MIVAGIILAGGVSRRFGADKASVLLDGRPLIHHVADRLAPQTDVMALAGSQQDYGLPHEVLPDGAHASKGPLAGLAAGLDWATRMGAAFVLTAPCDVPFLPANLAGLLLDTQCGRQDSRPAALSINDYVESACALWPTHVLPAVAARLTGDGSLSLIGALRALDARMVAVDADMLDGDFTNINTLDDLRQVRG